MTAFQKGDHISVLRAVEELPFNVGKRLLMDILQGNSKNETIVKNRMNSIRSFGALAYSDNELGSLIDALDAKGLLHYIPLPGKPYIKVIGITKRGLDEIQTKSLTKTTNYPQATVLTELDKKLFSTFNFFLGDFTDEQKKAVVCPDKNILCIAGAGSGKTAALTKRIEFLIRFRSIASDKILAITFTRKARLEMIKRLEEAGMFGVRIETFNSFCEGLLKKYESLAYARSVRVISYGDKIRLLRRAITNAGTSMGRATDVYFSVAQRKSKTPEQLSAIFLNDCFYIIDYYKSQGLTVQDFASGPDAYRAQLMVRLCRDIESQMQAEGLRDFTDQLMDVISLFKKNPPIIPQFDHVLVDEYQDVNDAQVKIIELLNAPNLFCVGDPRQAIFGWRGSHIRYILDFPQVHNPSTVIHFTKNFRSTPHIVNIANLAIRQMGLPDLHAARIGPEDARMLGFETEDAEHAFVVQRILETDVPRQEIFVLARTNRQLNDLAQLMSAHEIPFQIRSDERAPVAQVAPNHVTLATVHAIKGLEAHTVFVIGCTTNSFPCRTSEHPVIELLNVPEYDKDDEEKRLFYVALSRAKYSLCLTYSGKKHTTYITDTMKEILTGKKIVKPVQSHLKPTASPHGESSSSASLTSPPLNDSSDSTPAAAGASSPTKNNELFERLRGWRLEKSKAARVPAYMILTDATLMELVSSKPYSMEDFEGVTGMGTTRIRRYGKELLEVIHAR